MFDPLALKQMWMNAWPVLSLLAACSILSGAIILERWAALSRADFKREKVLGQLQTLLGDQRPHQAVSYCESLRKPVGNVLAALVKAVSGNRRSDREQLGRLTDRLVRAESLELHRYLTALGTIGSVTPFVGLFGTVIGIIRAFRAIAEQAGGGPGVIAHGIAEALVATAMGLFAAIPAVVAYNLYTRRIERLSEEIKLCADELTDRLVSPP